MAVLVRLLLRIAAVGLVGALARRAAPHPYRTPGQQPTTHIPADRVRQLRGVVEGAGMVVRLLTIMVLLAATGILFAAGFTLTSLGPRWVGIPLLVLCAVTLLLTALEARALRRIVVRRRRGTWLRRHGELP
jgi:Na+-transporting methylmalonyl-CoA/oxaloacetate decarboxylase gamma subunit